MHSDQIKYLLKKYQDGSCTEEEFRLISDWLDNEKNPGSLNSDKEGKLDLEMRRINEAIIRTINPTSYNKWFFLKLAALVILVSNGVFFLFSYYQRQSERRAAFEKRVEREERDGWVEIRTPKGKTATFELPDRSVVALNASSKIRFPKVFGGFKRPVYLDEGEAYFSVAKDKSKPFTVYTSSVATTALGTAFNVRNYKREHAVSVALIHGRVRVEDLKISPQYRKANILKPHQQIILNTASKEVENREFQNEIVVAGWKEGVLSFNNASAEEVINSIENRFDVRIKNNSKQTNWKYTGTFKDEKLNEVLETICLTEGVTFKMLSTDSIEIN